MTARSSHKKPGRPARPVSRMRTVLVRLAIVLFWLLVWQAASMSINSKLILVSPITVLQRLGELSLTQAFWLTVAQSFGRIVAGFLLGLGTALVLACLSARWSLIEKLLEPLVLVVKSIPVASFIMVVLMWVSPANLAIIVSFLMVAPVIYTNVLKGIQQTSGELLEMARVFRVNRRRRLRFIYFSQVLPFFVSGTTVALGLCWKAGIAAEVIGLPDGSLGDMLYRAKLYLNTADLFAWTLVIVLISLCFEKLFLALVRRAARALERG